MLSILVLAIAALLGSLYAPLSSNTLFARQLPLQPPTTASNILLLTAHPDDEALFFAPTILALRSSNLYHLCLSTGNADGLGTTRTNELARSLDVLGISPAKRWIVNHPDLQDNITAAWDPAVIAAAITPYVLDLHIDTILTFDDAGISSHPNHIALPLGAASLSLPHRPRIFTLTTTTLPIKYISLLSVPLAQIDIYTLLFSQRMEALVLRVLSIWYPQLLTPSIPRHPDAHAMPLFVSGYTQYLTALQAMGEHQSQMVWFRYLNVAFSRYMWVNSYTELSVVSPK